jgi:hypothetical protein
MNDDSSNYGNYGLGTTIGNSMTVYNKTEIMNKLVEPENNIRDVQLNRNLVLGNIRREQLTMYDQISSIADLLLFIPKSEGGFLFNEIGHLLDTRVNTFFVMSNSVDAKGRSLGVTQIRKDEVKQIEEKGGFGSFAKSSNSN